MKNIEIKVQIKDIEVLLPALKRLGVRKIGVIHQTDTYYKIAKGRLKVREERNASAAELIYYHRPNAARARVSAYCIVRVPSASVYQLKNILVDALGICTKVRKVRTLYLWRQTRIHIDRVEKLGMFLEVETPMHSRSRANAQKEYSHVYRSLALHTYSPIPTSYADLSLNPYRQPKEVHRAFHARRRKE